MLCVKPAKEPNLSNFVNRPFVYCLVQSAPGLDFARDFLLEGIHRRVILPWYKAYCRESDCASMRIECFLTYLFSVINRRDTSLEPFTAVTTSICGLNRRGRYITHERIFNPSASCMFPSANLSMKTLLRVAYQSPSVIVQIINCILLERKIVIVSPTSTLHHMRRNAIFIETLLELIEPFL